MLHDYHWIVRIETKKFNNAREFYHLSNTGSLHSEDVIYWYIKYLQVKNENTFSFKSQEILQSYWKQQQKIKKSVKQSIDNEKV